MTILFAFLLLDLMAHNNMHKSKAAVPSCEQSNLIFAEVDLTVLQSLKEFLLQAVSSEVEMWYCMYILYIYIHTPPLSKLIKEALTKR